MRKRCLALGFLSCFPLCLSSHSARRENMGYVKKMRVTARTNHRRKYGPRPKPFSIVPSWGGGGGQSGQRGNQTCDVHASHCWLRPQTRCLAPTPPPHKKRKRLTTAWQSSSDTCHSLCRQDTVNVAHKYPPPWDVQQPPLASPKVNVKLVNLPKRLRRRTLGKQHNEQFIE